jgi:hypothetical protein
MRSNLCMQLQQLLLFGLLACSVPPASASAPRAVKPAGVPVNASSPQFLQVGAILSIESYAARHMLWHVCSAWRASEWHSVLVALAALVDSVLRRAVKWCSGSLYLT